MPDWPANWPVEALALMLHESGREAVARGKVYVKAGLPFCEWLDLGEDAREGRRIMARYLLEHRARLKEILRADDDRREEL
jgi:hypothetical protein